MLKRKGKIAKEIYLTPYGLMAERHWRGFRPKMVRDLEAKGALMEALFEAQETTLAEMEALTRQLEAEQKMTSQQAHNRAWEMIREKYILLPLQCAFLADKIRLSFGESISIWHSSKDKHANGSAEHEQGGDCDTGYGERRAWLTLHDFAVGRD
jgi:hypothetical protein